MSWGIFASNSSRSSTDMTSRPRSNRVESSSASVGVRAACGACARGSIAGGSDMAIGGVRSFGSSERFESLDGRIILSRFMDSLTLPLDYSAIERILPHRYPFLLVDRITELEPDKRIVGIKNVSLNERFLSHLPGMRPTLPPTILTESG